MSKSERAMLRVAFFGVMFLMAVMHPIGFSNLAWPDKAIAAVSGAMMIGYAIRYLCLFRERDKSDDVEVEIVDTWKDKK